MEKLKPRHLVFIVGFICATITAIYNPSISISMIMLLGCIGFGIALKE